MEASKVRKCDIDLEAHTVALRGSSARVNHLNSWSEKAISLYLATHPTLSDDGLICTTRSLGQPDHRGPDNIYVYQLVKNGLREAGFDRMTGISGESLRFTGARWILESSGIVAAARFLGYASLDTTARVLEYKWKLPQADVSTTIESCTSHA